MADFRDELHEKERHADFGHRQFEALVRGAFRVSVQASETHYCTPREILPPHEYSAFEVAIFDATDPEAWEWVIPGDDARFKAFPWASEFESGTTTSVAGYIPVATVRQILADVAAQTDVRPEAK